MKDMDPKVAQILRTLALFAFSSLLLFWDGTFLIHAQTKPQVLTYHNDLARTGQNLNETVSHPPT